jgi:hypothetical protein
MTDRLTVVSTDCHAGLPIAQYKPYVDSKYHDFIDMAVDVQIDMMDKAEQQFLIKEINDEWRAPIQQELTGAWEYGERNKMLAKDGIAAEIIFPDGITEQNTPPFGAGLGLSPKDAVPELQWAGAMAHNRWLSELVANDPKRHFGVASIPLLFDVQQAVDAARWCHENGLKGVMLPTMWGEHAAYHDIKYDPFGRFVEDLGIVMHFHSGPAPHNEYFGPAFPNEDRSAELPGAMGAYVSEVMFWLYRPFTFMLWGGVFERFSSAQGDGSRGRHHVHGPLLANAAGSQLHRHSVLREARRLPVSPVHGARVSTLRATAVSGRHVYRGVIST